jgi:predicted DNA-binding transcriptional regulator YafY
VSDSVLRQWSILRSLPRYPSKLSARDIESRLRDEGFEASKRTIERDLEKLSGSWPISSDQRSRPYGWSWARDARVMDLPGMDLPTALAFRLAREYLTPLLPPATLQHLKPHFDQATEVLGQGSPSKLHTWPKKVRVIGHGPALMAPKTASGIHEAVLQALLENKRIEGRYTPRDSGEEREYLINPLGAVFRQNIVYLVGSAWDYEDILQFALHRFSEAKVSEQKARRPRGFDLDEYIREGAFGYPASNDRIRLKVLFDARTAHHLYETPLSEDQSLSPGADGRVELTASVLDTEDLRWWLLGFGDGVEVKAPAKLRREVASAAQSMSDLYNP